VRDDYTRVEINRKVKKKVEIASKTSLKDYFQALKDYFQAVL